MADRIRREAAQQHHRGRRISEDFLSSVAKGKGQGYLAYVLVREASFPSPHNTPGHTHTQHRPGQYLVVEVVDSGPGVDGDTSVLFQEFTERSRGSDHVRNACV